MDLCFRGQIPLSGMDAPLSVSSFALLDNSICFSGHFYLNSSVGILKGCNLRFFHLKSSAASFKGYRNHLLVGRRKCSSVILETTLLAGQSVFFFPFAEEFIFLFLTASLPSLCPVHPVDKGVFF